MYKPTKTFKIIFAAIALLIMVAILFGFPAFYNRPLWLGVIYFILVYFGCLFFLFFVFRFFYSFIMGQYEFLEAKTIWPLLIYVINYLLLFFWVQHSITILDGIFGLLGALGFLTIYM